MQLFVFSDNLALGKPALQSGIYEAAMDVNYPRRAVDGVKNTNRYYCASTGASFPDPYWRVDLEQVLPVYLSFLCHKTPDHVIVFFRKTVTVENPILRNVGMRQKF